MTWKACGWKRDITKVQSIFFGWALNFNANLELTKPELIALVTLINPLTQTMTHLENLESYLSGVSGLILAICTHPSQLNSLEATGEAVFPVVRQLSQQSHF